MKVKELDEIEQIVLAGLCIHDGDKLRGSLSDLDEWHKYDMSKLPALISDLRNYVQEILETNAEMDKPHLQLQLNAELDKAAGRLSA